MFGVSLGPDPDGDPDEDGQRQPSPVGKIGNFLRGKLRSLRVSRPEEEEEGPVNDSNEGYPESFLHSTDVGNQSMEP